MASFAWVIGRRLGGVVPVEATVAFVLLAFATTGLQSAGSDWSLVGVAAAAATGLIVASALLPWRRLPAAALLLLPIGCDGVLAIWS